MECDRERLEAYAGEQLSAKERAKIESHLARCLACRESLGGIEARGRAVREALASLDPAGAEERSDAILAYRRFRESEGRSAPAPVAATREPAPSWLERLRGLAVSWRTATVAFATVAALVVGISYAPAREVLAEFLSIFRVQQFTAVPVERPQLEKLASVSEGLLQGGLIQPTVERKPAAPQPVTSISEARSLAGFDVREPGELPPGMERNEFQVVAPGPVVRFDFNPRQVEAALAAAGIAGVDLPDVDAASVRAEVGAIANQSFTVPSEEEGIDPGNEPFVRIVQAVAPSVTLPPGLDVAALGEAYLGMLGVAPSDAKRLARTIDWTSTLVLPMPADLVNFREIEIDGTPALFLEGRGSGGLAPKRETSADASSGDASGGEPSGEGPSEKEAEEDARLHTVLLWQRDGIVTSLVGRRVAGPELLRIAESMR